MKQLSRRNLWLITFSVTLLLDTLGLILCTLRFTGYAAVPFRAILGILTAALAFGIAFPCVFSNDRQDKLFLIFAVPTNYAAVILFMFTLVQLCLYITSYAAGMFGILRMFLAPFRFAVEFS